MVSIVMPAYQAERYLETAVRSVQAQTFTDWELIIIDDHSSDCTADLAEALAGADARIRVLYNQENTGVAGSRNRGVTAARGEWIAFLDSDDAWREDKLEKQLACAVRHHADFLFTGSAFMNAGGEHINSYLPVPEKIGYRELLKQNLVSCSSVLIRRELVLEYPMRHADRLHEDFAVWLQILRDKKLAAYGINEPLLIYRLSAGSKSGNKAKAALMTWRVYRYLGLNPVIAAYYWLHYFIRSVRKYRGFVDKTSKQK